jgi:UDP-N-acetylmuramoyl-L-alanyl-D-glutamate--2,6-diaminopimelate ligase
MIKKTLKELLVDYINVSDVPDVSITGIAVDSREVKPGDVFVAIKDGVDRYDYVDQVIKLGAVAIVGENEYDKFTIPHVTVSSDRDALLHMSRKFYDYPAKALNLIGITGTDGKTTTANLLYSIMQTAEFETGMISTVNAKLGGSDFDTGFHVTTPEAMDVQSYLQTMKENNLSHVILETTSIGLSKKKVSPSEFDVAIVTNITHEHLDNHGSMDAYWEAKGRLFFELGGELGKNEVVAILNVDDKSYSFLKDRTNAKKVTYAIESDADFRATGIKETNLGISFTVKTADIIFPVECGLIGRFNVYNCLAAIATAIAVYGISPEIVRAGLLNFEGVSGRMEEISLGQNFRLFVDFAHTPNAIDVALQAAQRITNKRVIAVFGSAGLRDKEKRKLMAEISVQNADISIFTAEDPRTESLAGILKEMATGAVNKGGVEGESFIREPNRADAIRKAIAIAEEGDAVFILGKGHEQSMCFGVTEHPWDDSLASKSALSEYLNVPGPEMPKLPHQKL